MIIERNWNIIRVHKEGIVLINRINVYNNKK